MIVVDDRRSDRQSVRGGIVEYNLVLCLENRPPPLVDGRYSDCDESPRVFPVGHRSQVVTCGERLQRGVLPVQFLSH